MSIFFLKSIFVFLIRKKNFLIRKKSLLIRKIIIKESFYYNLYRFYTIFG